MINYVKDTLIILPHLDDEFALVPVIEKFVSINLSKLVFIYCCERINSTIKKQNDRRKDNLSSLFTLGIKKPNTIYLNDYFAIQDNYLYKEAKKIRCFLKKYIIENKIEQILTLNYEGGHPDHDQLALIINNLKSFKKFDVFYFPAYNHRRFFIFPFSVLKPLKIQEKEVLNEFIGKFCWIKTLKIAYIYKTEKIPFLILLPFLVIKSISSQSINYFDNLNKNDFNWNLSLSFKRYKVKKSYLFFTKFLNEKDLIYNSK